MTIGNIRLPEGAALAPMAGVADGVMRRLCAKQGAAWSVTEMVSAQGLICSPENAPAIERLLKTDPSEGIVGAQLFGRDPALFAQAAALLSERGFPFIDINMGCPARKIVAGGQGSALLQEPALCGKIVRAVKDAVRVPVTVKLRAGWDDDSKNAPLIAKILEDNGADALTIHGRTRQQQYSGQADRAIMAEVKRAVSIPVIANGDIRSARDARETLAETGCDAVMIGRGACGNPWVFQSVLRNEEVPLSPKERIEGAICHLRMQVSEMGEQWGVIEARKHVGWYLAGLRGAAALRVRINAMKTLEQVESALREHIETLSRQ